MAILGSFVTNDTIVIISFLEIQVREQVFIKHGLASREYNVELHKRHSALCLAVISPGISNNKWMIFTFKRKPLTATIQLARGNGIMSKTSLQMRYSAVHKKICAAYI